jgi:1,3,6,8-tetrahydroxynaphthalene synthase
VGVSHQWKEQFMPVLCRPAVAVPEHVLTMEETLELARWMHARNTELPLVLRLIRNTGVRKRHLVRPLAETLVHDGVEARTRVYVEQAKRRLPDVIGRALGFSGLVAEDVDLIVYVSCTGFTMPSMTAWLINALGFRSDTRQLPIAQLGCAAGGAAINRAHDFCTAYTRANVLVVSCEFCSLCYQPEDTGVGSLLSNGLFGDAVAAVVVRGEDSGIGGCTGVRLERNASYLVPGTEEWISYAVKETGFHFRLDRRVPGTMEALAPAVRDLVDEHRWDASALDFYVVHAGGPRILDDLSKYLDVPPEMFRHSRATLTEYGNIASAVVLDALDRLFQEGAQQHAARGMIAGFGPGITAEMAVGTWTTAAGSRDGAS